MQYSPETNYLPIGTQSFAKLRAESCVYVDKTKYIYNLVTGGRVYFLSRPRRFGKSLLITTLDAFFRGQRNLFKDTWIDSQDYDWSVHPVIRIDMTETNKTSVETFTESLIDRLAEIAHSYQVEVPNSKDASSTLKKLIQVLEEKHDKVVVLIDEYDKPIHDNILDVPLAESMRNSLRQFYSILKAQDEALRFVMLTGVTKFSKVSVFSGLNNLQDITMVKKYSALCGYTQSELEQNFSPWIESLAQSEKTSIDVQLLEIKLWYYGYQFSEDGERVYNPISMLVLFEHQAYKAHWFDTGTPTFLLDLIKSQDFELQGLNNLVVRQSDLAIHDLHNMGVVSLLYQTGYLTIKSYDKTHRNYTLGYPNFEVNEAFSEALFNYFSLANQQVKTALLDGLVSAIQQGNYDEMFTIIQTFFSAIAYQLHTPKETYYHSLFYLIFHIVGLRIKAEVQSNFGRLDALIKIDNRVLIFEFKLDKSAEIALQQIHDKQYYQPYQNQGKQIMLFGVNFSTTEINITDWQQDLR